MAVCCGGRVVIGTASAGQLRAAAEVAGDVCAHSRALCRVVVDFGRLLPADGLLIGPASPLSIVELDHTENADGFRDVMVTAGFAGPRAEAFLKSLGKQNGIAGETGDAVFIACLETGNAGAQVLAHLRQAATIRRSELGRLVRAAADAAGQRPLERA